ncbi:Tat pathway signal sequence domain protein, partial [Streptomyces sp. WAC07061]
MRHSNGIRRAALATTAVTAVAAAVTGILPGTAMAAGWRWWCSPPW